MARTDSEMSTPSSSLSAMVISADPDPVAPPFRPSDASSLVLPVEDEAGMETVTVLPVPSSSSSSVAVRVRVTSVALGVPSAPAKVTVGAESSVWQVTPSGRVSGQARVKSVASLIFLTI